MSVFLFISDLFNDVECYLCIHTFELEIEVNYETKLLKLVIVAYSKALLKEYVEELRQSQEQDVGRWRIKSGVPQGLERMTVLARTSISLPETHKRTRIQFLCPV
jgi:hypothetical protein